MSGNFLEHSKRLTVIYSPITSIAPADRNARTHSQAQIAQLVRSVREFGWTNPILIDEHATIIAGHGRLEAARSLGMAEVPTITLAGLSDAQRRALALADNKLALNAGWDEALLAGELDALRGLDFDVSLIGFSDDELADLLNEPDFAPVGEDQQGRLDERAPVTCPECGHVFSPA
jgi:ParB-like chromosome segregation protein Spo0J